jgi:hypothetical protein
LRLYALRRAFEGPPGTSFAITIGRGADVHEADLRLGSWIGRDDRSAGGASKRGAGAVRGNK